MNQKITGIICLIGTLIGGIGLLASASFVTQDPLLDSHITWGYNNGITKYDNIQSFKPNYQLTREQAIKMIVSWVWSNPAIQISGSTTQCNDFKDQSLIDETLQQAIQRSCEYGIIKGYQGYIMPQQMITSSELQTIIDRILSISNITPTSTQRGYYPTRAQLLSYIYTNNTVITKQAELQHKKQLEQAQSNLDQAKSTRSKVGLTNYQLTQQISCFCIEEYTQPVSYRVMSGVVVSGSAFYPTNTGVIVSGSTYTRLLTIPQAFDKIQEAIDQKADSITVTYDSTTGYPMQLSIDRSYMIADEEQYYSFKLLQQ